MVEQTFTAGSEGIEVVTEDTTTVVVPGPIGRTMKKIWNNKGKILTVLAVGGAGYLVYDAVKTGRAKEAADHAADAAAAVSRLV